MIRWGTAAEVGESDKCDVVTLPAGNFCRVKVTVAFAISKARAHGPVPFQPIRSPETKSPDSTILQKRDYE
jgi:hypothetical protein